MSQSPCPQSPHATKPQKLSTIQSNSVVSLSFVLSDMAGTVLDLATQERPMRYLQGAGMLLHGLEKALLGQALGAHLQVTLSPEEAYGPRDGEPQAVPKSLFPEGTDFYVGAAMMAKSDDGKPFPLWIVDIDEEHIYVDGNHPLAGQTLHFDVQVLDIREATAEEIKEKAVHDGCELCR